MTGGWKKPGITHRKLLFPVLFAVISLLFAAALLPPEPVWITDNGNKLMIMHNFMEHGSIFFDHPSPENFPFGGFHFQTLENGRITSFHSPYLPVMTAWLCKISGKAGVLLIPVVSLALILSVMLEFPGKKYRILIALAAAPLFFYSLLLWEMIPAALTVTLAAWLFFRGRTTVAGAVFAAGLWMREELWVLGAILALILICQKQWKIMWRFALGAAIPAAALLLCNTLLFGNPAGVHGSTYFVNNRPEMTFYSRFREVIFNFYQHLIRFDTLGRWSAPAAFAVIIPALAAGFAPGYRRWRKFKKIAGVIFAAGTLLFAAALWKEKQYLFISAVTFGLFISVPVLAGFLLNLRPLLCDRNRFTATAARLSLLYILIVPFLLNPHDIGLTWGARHFIMIIPVMIGLSIYGMIRAGFFTCTTGKAVCAACAAAGIIMQLYAVTALVKVTADTENLQNEILAIPQKTVVSDLFFIPEMTPQVPFAKTQLEISSAKQLESAINYLEKENISSFILILSPDYRRISNEQLKLLLHRYPPAGYPVKLNVGNSLDFLVTLCRKTP